MSKLANLIIRSIYPYKKKSKQIMKFNLQLIQCWMMELEKNSIKKGYKTIKVKSG
jgi:hypothetical protein